MDFHLSDVYQDEEGNSLYDVQFDNGINLKGLQVSRPHESKCKNCRFMSSNQCKLNSVRSALDCKCNVAKLQGNLIWFLTLLELVVCYSIFATLPLPLFIKIVLCLASLIFWNVSPKLAVKASYKIYNSLFYKHLIKLMSSQKKKEELLEIQFKKQETLKIANEPYYKQVLNAKETVKQLRDISDKYDYGPSEEKIDTCVTLCETILQGLEENSSTYCAVMPLFEVYIPEFIGVLTQYNILANNNNTEMEEHERVLLECVNIILQYIEHKSKEAQEKAQTSFTSSASALKTTLPKELGK